MEPLHDDNPDASLIINDTKTVRVVRNLTAAEYAATYAAGTPHALPADVEAELGQEAARIAAAREG